jgi:plastocyanin
MSLGRPLTTLLPMKGGKAMNGKFRIATLALPTAAVVFAATASAHGPKTVTIRHQMRGCHSWSFANGPYKATLKIRVDRDATVRFVNNDVMPHKLVQLAGPKATITKANMKHMSAVAVLTFPREGLYRFTTKAGEDYPSMGAMKTIGEDNVLRLTVVVS